MDSGVESAVQKDFSFEENFIKGFPIYLFYGMTPDEYWHGDPSLAYAYREAYKEKQKQKNFDAWLSGRYIYDAIIAVSPIFNPFAKKGTKPLDYTKEPYPLFDDEKIEKQEVKRKTGFDRIKAFAMQYKKEKK